MTILYWLNVIGLAVFAISGALMAARLKMDPFGVVVLAALTSIGGGTIRDIILDVPQVFWIEDPSYLNTIIITALVTMVFVNYLHRIPEKLLLIADAAGLALFSVLGAQKALLYGAPGEIAVVMGVITGAAGGILRDVVCRQIPMVLRKDIYATACLLSCVTYTGLLLIDVDDLTASLVGIGAGFILRLAAIQWHLQLPAYQLRRRS
ncbi:MULTISPECIES: trimeric intracellular cation channel family protein [Corallincola]|uniref:Trimeric intracellular cation channel family protein n=3 Tax=Corallincola TaxID=1775176 RepID=A0A368NP22_9GAMM|nr:MULTISPECIES: trimeric intracellular cation channel family protein [Corallincola]RCU51633.1 trimeric intracellular cation channel family protein [Corallincola holothuriorum]TAA47134.1 trimeric intracellular cation channel family protein [Corallincola spongiicola]TCI04791.1 trimeric intracellular cation channel family protein [Corallincola luteus]